jgi:hypothetical protein
MVLKGTWYLIRSFKVCLGGGFRRVREWVMINHYLVRIGSTLKQRRVREIFKNIPKPFYILF